jgi:hypothetical protein
LVLGAVEIYAETTDSGAPTSNQRSQTGVGTVVNPGTQNGGTLEDQGLTTNSGTNGIFKNNQPPSGVTPGITVPPASNGVGNTGTGVGTDRFGTTGTGPTGTLNGNNPNAIGGNTGQGPSQINTGTNNTGTTGTNGTGGLETSPTGGPTGTGPANPSTGSMGGGPGNSSTGSSGTGGR